MKLEAKLSVSTLAIILLTTSIGLTANSKTKTYSGYGISFDYPKEIEPKVAAASPDFTVLTLVSASSGVVMIQVYSNGVEPAEVQDALLKKYQETFPGGKVESVKRSVGGTLLDGKKHKFSVKSLPHTQEIYAFKKEKLTVALVTQSSNRKLKNDKEFISTVLTTLKLEEKTGGEK